MVRRIATSAPTPLPPFPCPCPCPLPLPPAPAPCPCPPACHSFRVFGGFGAESHSLLLMCSCTDRQLASWLCDKSGEQIPGREPRHSAGMHEDRASGYDRNLQCLRQSQSQDACRCLRWSRRARPDQSKASLLMGTNDKVTRSQWQKDTRSQRPFLCCFLVSPTPWPRWPRSAARHCVLSFLRLL